MGRLREGVTPAVMVHAGPYPLFCKPPYPLSSLGFALQSWHRSEETNYEVVDLLLRRIFSPFPSKASRSATPTLDAVNPFSAQLHWCSGEDWAISCGTSKISVLMSPIIKTVERGKVMTVYDRIYDSYAKSNHELPRKLSVWGVSIENI